MASTTVKVIGFDPLTQNMSIVPNQSIDYENKIVTAAITNLYPMFSIFASSRDRTPPSTELAYFGPVDFGSTEKLVISTETLLYFTYVDYGSGRGPATGFASIKYIIDPASTDPAYLRTLTPTDFTGFFSLPPGLHTIVHYGADAEGNDEEYQIIEVDVRDVFGPLTWYEVLGSSIVSADGNLYISDQSTISLIAVDIGTANVATSYYYVDPSTSLLDIGISSANVGQSPLFNTRRAFSYES